MNYPLHCQKSRQPCAEPYTCGTGCKLVTATDSGRKVAHGRAIDYTGKEADEIVMFEPPSVWDGLAENARFWIPCLALMALGAFAFGYFRGLF